MEQIRAIFEEEWNSSTGICFDEAEFMSQLIGNCPLPDEAQHDASPPFWFAGFNGSSMNSQGSSSYESYPYPNAHHVFVDFPTMDNYCTDDFLNQDVSNDSLETCNMSEDVLEEKNVELGIALPNPNSESRKRAGGVGGNKRSVRAKKCMDGSEEDKDNAVVVRNSSTGCCSEDDSGVHGVASSSCSKGTGKTRANRGSATDPQSLYARKRRERINEKLRILQKLVPNGTKVDISTMLEEAVEYVKFLQLQIKLLSSDDMWMYAPIAYNGMNINLN